MSKFVNGQRYDTDFFPIDDQGNRIGDRDLGASDTWTNANEPWRNTPGWHGQPLSAEQSAGRKAADPAAWAAREQWQAMNPMWQSGIYAPTGTGGGGTGGGGGGSNNQFQFDWGGWDVGAGGSGGGAQQAPMTGEDWAQTYSGPQATTNTTNRGVRGGRVDVPGLAPPASGGPSFGQFGPPQEQPGEIIPPPFSEFGPPQQPPGDDWASIMPLPPNGPPQQGPRPTRPPVSSYPNTGRYDAPLLDNAALLSQLGLDTQGAIQRGLRDPSVNPNDPAYRAQVEMNNRNTQRATDRRRASEAQRAHAGGTLRSGGFDSRVSGILEDQGAQEADFEAGLMQSELTAGRDRQARAMQLGAGLLSQEQQQDLQSRLANQGSRLQTNALNTQDRLGTNDSILRRNALMLQQQLGLSDLDLRRLGLMNQNSQYYAGLGQQLGLGQAQLNQDALLALLRG